MKGGFSLIILFIIFLVIGFLSFFIQTFCLDFKSLNFREFLTFTYVFFYSFSSLILTILFFIHEKTSLKFQIGYIYLFTVFIKLGLYFIVFQNQLGIEILSNFIVKINLLIPMFLTLFFEVIFLAKILKKSAQ